MIDKLDLQSAIRQKARVYFNKEQTRMASEQFQLSESFMMEAAATHVNSQFAKRVRQDHILVETAKADFHKTAFAGKNNNDGMPEHPYQKQKAILKDLMQQRESVDSDDEDLLNNMFNERQVASQEEIQRNLQVITAKKVDTLGTLHSVTDEG